MSTTFKKAEKSQLKARITLDGPTGGGKTYSALVFATAFVEKTGGRIAVIDTENGRALAYADQFDFDHVDLRAPYSPQRYVDLMNAAIAEGYEVVVVDSLSHAWSAEGGVLDIKDKATERSQSKNSFDAWRHASPEHDKLVNALVNCPIHLITTMRSKMAYVLEEQNRDGRKVQVPRKLGLQPIQREGMEYEFDLILDVDLDHVLVVSKTRCSEMADLIIRNQNHDPSETYAAARRFYDWLNSGKPEDRQWLDELCDTFGEGEVLDAINVFNAKASKPAFVSLKQVNLSTPADRVALLRSYLEDKARAVETESSDVDTAFDGPDASAPANVAGGATDAPTRSDEGDGGPSGSPDPEASVAGGGDETATSEEGQPHGSTAPSSRNGHSNDPKEVLDRAKRKQKKAPGQTELADGSSSQARGGDPSAQVVPEGSKA